MKKTTKVGLVQINNSFDQQCYLPYTAGMLQAYAQRHLKRPEDFSFSIPVFNRVRVEEATDRLEDSDIVCFSTYVWNVRLSLAIAAELKKRRPEILTVFGGPQIPDRDPETFLRDHPQVDLAVHGEGERVFLALLENYPSRDWQQVPSLSYLNDGGKLVQTKRCERITDMTEIPSPFIEGVFEPLIKAHPEIQWVGLWETNRGCPFTCAYCDWGSKTKNRVVARDIEDIYEETDWFSDHKIEFIFCCDANFSLLERDLDIVKKVVANKRIFGYPKALSVQSTKNFTETSYAIYELMGGAGLSKGVSLSLQSVHEPTLAAIERKNIPVDVFREAQHRLSSLGIETFTDIILPLPEETYESFVTGICNTMDNGQHHRIQFNNLSILPNAFMGDPEYQARYGFETVETDIVNVHGQLSTGQGLREKQQLVIGTSAMPRADWVKSRVFCWMTGLLHYNKLLQIPLIVLNRLYGLDYQRMLTPFMNGGLPPVLNEIKLGFVNKALAIQAGDVEFCQSQRWLNIWWPADELAMIRICTEGKLDTFYREAEWVLHKLLEKQGGGSRFAHVLEEAILLNRHLIKLPQQTEDDTLDLTYNLWEVYQGALQGQDVSLDHAGYQYHINRTKDQWTSWEDWCRRVIWWGNKRGAYLYACSSEFRVESSELEAKSSGFEVQSSEFRISNARSQKKNTYDTQPS